MKHVSKEVYRQATGHIPHEQWRTWVYPFTDDLMMECAYDKPVAEEGGGLIAMKDIDGECYIDASLVPQATAE